MKRMTSIGIFLLLFGLLPAADAADTYVLSGETLQVGAGDHHERVVVYPQGTLLIQGGSITQAPPIHMDSVEVSAGGRCVMTNGVIDYFMNNGHVEMYGGSTGSSSSENHGYLMLAGGDPGGQIVQKGGVLDLFYTATTRTNLEISSDNNNPPDATRIFSISNSLGFGMFEVGDLPLVVVAPPWAEVTMDVTFWTPTGNFNATLTHLIPTNWNGTIVSEPMVAPSPTDVVCQIDSAVELEWASISNRGYQVQYTTNLLSGTWQNLGSPVYSTEGTNQYFDSANEEIKAYRAKILH